MKELSIEEKAKRYDEAFDRARKLKEVPTSVFYEYTPSEGDTVADYIFPELKEREEEECKKWILEYLYDGLQKSDEQFKGQFNAAIAWLEKQGEQKLQGKSALEAINEEKVDNANKVEPRQEELTEFERAVKQVMEEAIECGDTHNLKADAEMLLSLVHKSAWSEDDELHIRELESLVKQVWTTAEHENDKDTIHKMSDLSFFLKTLKPQPKQEWSEEDEDIQNEAIYFIRREPYRECDAEPIVEWLKSLKDRVQPQPKQEWSKDSKRKMYRIYSILGQAADAHAFSTTCRLIGDKECIELQDFLKSLRPHNTWKPSDEQIKVLEFFIPYVTECSVVLQKSKDTLSSLLSDLRKLREE